MIFVSLLQSVYIVRLSVSKEQIRLRLLHEFQLGHSADEACRNVCTALGNKAVGESTQLENGLLGFVKETHRREREVSPRTLKDNGL